MSRTRQWASRDRESHRPAEITTLADETAFLRQSADRENTQGLPVVVGGLGVPTALEAPIEETVEVGTECPGVEFTAGAGDAIAHLSGVLVQLSAHPGLERRVQRADPVEVSGEPGQRVAHGGADGHGGTYY